MTRRRLPIGIQTFRKLREQDCYYVDKTAYVERLLREGTHYFLSRPRRFGKSLFLDTLKEFFAGSEDLFAGLYIHDRHDWTQRHPVVRLSFGSGTFMERGTLEANIMEQLAAAERRAGLAPEYLTAAGRFAYLLEALHGQTGRRVAVLVDEYDKPILDALVEAPEVARANRDYLRGLYGVIKDCDAHVRFTFPDRYQQVLEGQSLFAVEQPHRPHPAPSLLVDLRLHGGGPRNRVRAGAGRTGQREGARVVQWLPEGAPFWWTGNY